MTEGVEVLQAFEILSGKVSITEEKKTYVIRWSVEDQAIQMYRHK